MCSSIECDRLCCFAGFVVLHSYKFERAFDLLEIKSVRYPKTLYTELTNSPTATIYYYSHFKYFCVSDSFSCENVWRCLCVFFRCLIFYRSFFYIYLCVLFILLLGCSLSASVFVVHVHDCVSGRDEQSVRRCVSTLLYLAQFPVHPFTVSLFIPLFTD